MTSIIERQHTVHPAERWNSPYRVVARSTTQAQPPHKPQPAAPARPTAPARPAEPAMPARQPRARRLREQLLDLWRRLQPSTWGLLMLVALNMVLLPLALIKGS